MIGQIVRANSFRYTVNCGGQRCDCVVRGIIKRQDELYVGDYVEFERTKGQRYGVITGVKPRRNLLIRPYVSNSDIVLIVIATVPETDFLLVDKLIINCHIENIRPVIVLNKSDLQGCAALESKVRSEYGGIVDICVVSAETGQGLEKLKEGIRIYEQSPEKN